MSTRRQYVRIVGDDLSPADRKRISQERYVKRNKKKIAAARAIYKRSETVRLRENENRTRRRKRDPDKTKHHDRVKHLKMYGLTIAQYDNLLMEQNSVCAICKRPCSTGNRLSIDHDHKTKRVRGLLCRKCNRGVGHFDDNIDILGAAIIYLSKDNNGS